MLSHHIRHHWEMTRLLVLQVVTDDVTSSAGCRDPAVQWAGTPAELWSSTALQDARELLCLLVEVGVPTPMKLWALTRAAEGDCACPSQNNYNRTSTADIAIRIRELENDRDDQSWLPSVQRRPGKHVLIGDNLSSHISVDVINT